MRPATFTVIAFIALPFAATMPAASAPRDAIGSAITVVNYVTATPETEGDERRLRSGDDVRQQELIETDAASRSEIELNDRTRLALGPGSRLLLDKFVYDPDISGGAIVMDLVKGAFRFITGVAAKPAYVIRTPAAAITVRGTVFDLYVANADETLLLLLEGAVEVCTGNGRCFVHDQPGKLIRITARNIDRPTKWAQFARKRDVPFARAFPFVVEPPIIDPTPIFTRYEIEGSGDDGDGVEPPRRPKKTSPKPPRNDDDYTPPQRKVPKYERRKHRSYPREVEYRHPRRPSRGQRILKKGLKVGIGVGIGYGLAKALKRRY